MAEKADSMRRSYANVMLVQRVLAVLQAVNRLSIITIKGISDECGIPPSSVVRIVETLCAEGYLTHLSRSGGYVLNSKICSLSAGFHGAPLVVDVLKAYADELTRKHLWPLSVATLDHDAMVIQYSSIPLSPLAHVRTTLHKRLSLLSRAHGIAYVAFCSSMERHRLLRMAVEHKTIEDEVIADAQCWRRMIVQTRRRGYAIRAPEVDPSTRTIAVPIMIEPGRVVATLGMTFFKSVVRETQVVTFAATLKGAAAAASDRLREEMNLRAPVSFPTPASKRNRSLGRRPRQAKPGWLAKPKVDGEMRGRTSEVP
jgi:IclR family mhp operon transcriptional activator